MLLPFRSKNPPETFPFVTCGLILVNIMVFVFTSENLAIKDSVVDRFGLTYGQMSFEDWIASLFLHGDILHLLGNMWFLYLFGFAIEGRLKVLKFLALYLVSGLAGDALHMGVFGAAYPEIPLIGASGAIMGCLGAALYAFPHARVDFVFSFTIFYWRIVTWKMMWVAAYYIGFDILFAFLSSGGGGVANLAHIGGALGGFLMCLAYRVRRDTEFASDAKATLHESKDLSILSPRELEDLHGSNPSDTLTVLHWMSRSLKDHRGPNPACVAAFDQALPSMVNEQDPRAVASVLTQIGLDGRNLPSTATLRLAMKLEQASDPATAFRLYEQLIASRPPPEDYQSAIFRSALILENHYFNFDRCAQGYRYLDKEFPMGAFTDQARSRLAALQKTGRVS